jgi:hypothetical protein
MELLEVMVTRKLLEIMVNMERLKVMVNMASELRDKKDLKQELLKYKRGHGQYGAAGGHGNQEAS